MVFSSGGLTIMCKGQIECQVTGYSQNHIDVVFSVNNIDPWRLTCLYGYLERPRRKESWDLIRLLASVSQLPWCIWGDFNDLLHILEKKDINPRPQNLMDGFRVALEDIQLSEIDLGGGKFTWEKK